MLIDSPGASGSFCSEDRPEISIYSIAVEIDTIAGGTMIRRRSSRAIMHPVHRQPSTIASPHRQYPLTKLFRIGA